MDQKYVVYKYVGEYDYIEVELIAVFDSEENAEAFKKEGEKHGIWNYQIQAVKHYGKNTGEGW